MAVVVFQRLFSVFHFSTLPNAALLPELEIRVTHRRTLILSG